jgi:hypothetical protein
VIFGAPCQLRLLAGPEHGRTIPLADIGVIEIPQGSGLLPESHVLGSGHLKFPEVRSDHDYANSFRTAPSLCTDMRH